MQKVQEFDPEDRALELNRYNHVGGNLCHLFFFPGHYTENESR